MKNAPLKDSWISVRVDQRMKDFIEELSEDEECPNSLIVRKLLKEALIARGKSFDQKKDKTKK